MEEAEVGGAALIILNKATGAVEEACFAGLSAGFRSDYVFHYAAVDPYSPLLDRRWVRLSECLPASILRRSEWYNDFVLGCGVRDILGTRLVDTPRHRLILGLHQQIGRTFSSKIENALNVADVPLRRAARRYVRRLAPSPGHHRVLPAGKLYFFHLEGARRYPDQTGATFSRPAEAIAHAVRIARELAQDGSWQGLIVVAMDEDGQVVTRVPVET
jgi:hypothetical protein